MRHSRCLVFPLSPCQRQCVSFWTFSQRQELAKQRQVSSVAPPLSAKEEAEIRSLFAELDADGSGDLDAEEIEEVLVRMGRPLTKRALAEAMEEMDVDQSGDVDFGEFRQWCAPHTHPPPPTPTPTPTPHRHRGTAHRTPHRTMEQAAVHTATATHKSSAQHAAHTKPRCSPDVAHFRHLTCLLRLDRFGAQVH